MEMTFLWTPSKTSEADSGMHLQSFKKPKHLLSSLPRQGRTQRPSFTGQSHKCLSAVRLWKHHARSTPNPRTVNPHLNVVIERPTLVLTPRTPPRLSFRPQDTSWRRQTVKRPVPRAVTFWSRARLQALLCMLPLQRLFPSTPVGSAAEDRSCPEPTTTTRRMDPAWRRPTSALNSAAYPPPTRRGLQVWSWSWLCSSRTPTARL